MTNCILHTGLIFSGELGRIILDTVEQKGHHGDS